MLHTYRCIHDFFLLDVLFGIYKYIIYAGISFVHLLLRICSQINHTGKIY